MRKVRLFATLAAVGIIACQPAEMTTQERIRLAQEVEASFNGWVEAMNSGNRDRVMEFFHNHEELVVFWPDGSVANGWDAQNLAMHNFLNATRYMNFVVSQARTELLSPRAALSTFGHSTDVIQQDSNRDVTPGKGTIVWVRDAETGSWKIHFQQMSANRLN